MIYDTQYTSLNWIDFGLKTPTFSPLWLLYDNYDSKQYCSLDPWSITTHSKQA